MRGGEKINQKNQEVIEYSINFKLKNTKKGGYKR